MTALRRTAAGLVVGLWMGASLTSIGFADYDEVRRMMRLEDLRLHFTFGGAMLLAAAAYAVLSPHARARGRRISARVILGAVVFGIGWGLCLSCPASVLVQIASGNAWAVGVLVAIVAGMAAADVAARRLGWGRSSCDSD